MKALEIEKGTIFGDLVVLDHVAAYYNYREHIARRIKAYATRKCRCSCGRIHYVLASKLINGRVKSCGHIKNQSVEQVSLSLIVRMKSSAKERDISWELTDIEAIELISSNCFYCDALPKRTFRHNSTYITPIKRIRLESPLEILYNGIDRLNNDLGYININCVPCCKECNYAKHAQSLDDFLIQIKSIYEHLDLQHYNKTNDIAKGN